LKKFSNKNGAVFIYQSLNVMQDAVYETRRIIWLAAFISFGLTTFFALFLSRQIAKPLRKMREVAIDVTKGKFETEVPILTNDEIGELAMVINKMSHRLKINMNDLRQEKEQLSSILSSMADGVIMFNRNGNIQITNPPADRFLSLYQYEDGDHVNVPTEIMSLFNDVFTTGKEEIGDVSVQGRFWTVIISPLYNNDHIRGAVAVLRDMTEQRQLDKIRNDFVANVSHELRTPIAMLQGYSEALIDDVVSSEEDRKEIATILNEESLRMGRLVNELLDLAKLESGNLTLYKQRIEIVPYVQKIVKKFTGLARENEVTLNVTTQEDHDAFTFDPDRIEQVMTNLIDNAIRHTQEGGTIEINQSSDDEGLYIEITDNGSGIPSEDLPFVFERFYKADKARTRGKSGTGLGLAIAKNIVTAHHGKIEVKSMLGNGTTFSFFIPRNYQ
jgi:two-component system, OmpR family, sensor histidine kinase ResE